MSEIHKTRVARTTSVFLSLATAATLVSSVIAPGLAFAQSTPTIAELLAQIATLQAQLQQLQGGGSGGSMSKCAFAKSLTVGSRGEDVRCLQQYLNSSGYQVAASGSGSPGSETTYFGSLTRSAVAKWQAANGVSPAVGYFGPLSQAKYNSMATGGGGGTPPPTPGPITTPGTGLTVSSGTQPGAQLAPTNIARIPFTRVILTAGTDGDVTVNGLTVERTGPAVDAVLSGIVLLDEDGTQIGIAKTLNSSHQTTVGEPFVVKAGTSKTVTIAGNRDAGDSAYAGSVVFLSVVGVSTSATVTGALPITGAGHTINQGLTVGSVTMVRGSTDPGSSQTKEVGLTGYTFSSVKVTAGSAEKIYLQSMRWNQTGSAAKGDLANIKTYVEGTAYDTAVSSDGKYYTSKFADNGGKGILIDKGFSKEISVKGDVAGGSGRTVDFDVAKRNDIGLLGETYGFGITPLQTGTTDPTDDTAAFSSTEDPWYDAAQVTISAGTMQVSSSSLVPAQNIAVNLANQNLGSFRVDVKGEPISVGRIGFNITLGSNDTDDIDDITNVVLVDENGAVVAGPADGTAADSANTSGAGEGSIIFTDSVTFPIGIHDYKLLGKVGTDIDNNTTITASTTPSNDFATVRGQITGNTITPSPTSAVTGSVMTVKTGAMSISVSTIPIAQTVIANAKAFLFANYIFDGTASGEDLRITTVPLEYNVGNGGTATSLTNCQLYDGTTSLTTGSNVKNATAAASSSTFTFDGTGLVIPKGTAKTIALKCDVGGGATGSYEWGIDGAVDDTATTYTGVTGLTSGQTITETVTDSEGQLMTAASGGSLAVTLDSNSPGYKIVSAGTTGVELARIKFSATNEAINLKQVALEVTQAASNTPIDFVGRTVKLYDAANPTVLIGTAVFPTADYATSSSILEGSFTVPRDGAKTLIVRGDIAGISASGPLVRSGDLISVDYDGNNTGLNGTYGTGVESGSTITPTGSDTASAGQRIMKAYPTLAQISLTSNERVLTAGDNKTLYKFSVTANNGDIALYKVTFSVSSSTASGSDATTTKFTLYAFANEAMSAPDPNFDTSTNPGGLVNAGNCYSGRRATFTKGTNSGVASGLSGGGLGAGSALIEIYPDKSGCNLATSTALVVPSGSTRWFKLVGSIGALASSGTTDTIQVQLEGDAAFPVGFNTLMGIAGTTTPTFDVGTASGVSVNFDTHNDFIWSPRSTSTSESVFDIDWTNGFGLTGLPGTNMTAETITK